MLLDRTDGNPEQQPSPDAIRTELEKILSSRAFVQSPQLCQFLRFVVDQELAGQGAQLKEYLLGVEVFRKEESFDPRLDTVVRTVARRLRNKLAETTRPRAKPAAPKSRCRKEAIGRCFGCRGKRRQSPGLLESCWRLEPYSR